LRLSAKLSVRDLDLEGQRVFLRVDFNVPLEDGAIGDDTRIRASLPTIEYVLARGGLPVVASHLGRPKGKPKAEFSLAPVARHLAGLLTRPVKFASDCVGAPAEGAVEAARRGEASLVLLENLRFHAEEEANDEAFAARLASLADRYVNDAFGAAHRAHASVDAVPRRMARPAAGLLMEKELRYLGGALESPERPFVAILGGAKVSDKLEVIENLLPKVDRLLIGGAMAYTFFRQRGYPTGTSLVEEDKVDDAARIVARAAELGVPLELPLDHVVADRIDEAAATEVLGVSDAGIGDRKGLDIGPETVAAFSRHLAGARTVVWNGPMGVFEIDAFANGTLAVADAVAHVSGTTIVGGGDSIAAIRKAGVSDKVTHISTGGGASLEFLGGRRLPGVDALADR
jgi:phosphoglycerate kinase